MSLVNAALNQIDKYGYKGAAVLNRITKVKNKTTGENTTTNETPSSLLAYVGSYPISDVVDTTVKTAAYRIWIAPDNDFDGVISKDDTVTVDGNECRIVRNDVKRVKDKIAYVEVICGV